MDDMVLKMDTLIEGFDLVKGVPIEIKGCWSFEISPNSDQFWQKIVDKKHPKDKPSMVVNVQTDGKQKIITFESSLLISNNTNIDIELSIL